jgi:hypothetical protein
MRNALRVHPLAWTPKFRLAQTFHHNDLSIPDQAISADGLDGLDSTCGDIQATIQEGRELNRWYRRIMLSWATRLPTSSYPKTTFMLWIV